MVVTESKKEYDELVEEILRRMKENNLYVKLEKCKQKIIKVDFLGVSNKTRRDKNRGRKYESGIGLASTKIG